MNAREIQQAVEGVAAECLDPNLTHVEHQKPQGWYEGDCYIAPSHAAKIQCDSMRTWLEDHEAVRYVCSYSRDPDVKDEVFVVVVGKYVDGIFDSVEYKAPTRLEALAKACRAMKENAQ